MSDIFTINFNIIYDLFLKNIFFNEVGFWHTQWPWFALLTQIAFGHLLMTLLQVYLIFDNTVGKGTVFENYSKCLISFFQFWDFPSIFVQLKLTANFSFSKNHQMRLLLWFSNTVRVCLFTAGVLQHFVTFSGIATVSFRDLIIISKMSSAPHYSCFCE